MSRRTKPPDPGSGPAPGPAGPQGPHGRPKRTPAQTPAEAEAPEQAKLYGADLANRGWAIQSVVQQGKTVFTSLDSFIPDWHNLNWADQVYHQAKYRFDSHGILSIAAGELTGTDPLLRRSIRTSTLHPNGYPLPGGAIPGTDERLKRLLEKTRTTLDYDSQNDSALIHTGPDGSIIVTNESGWNTATIENLRQYTLHEDQQCPWEQHPGHPRPPMPEWALPTSNLPLPSTTNPKARSHQETQR